MKLNFLQCILISIFNTYLYGLWSYKNRFGEIWAIFNKLNADYICFIIKKQSFLRLNILNDIVVIDWVKSTNRFEIIYNMFSYAYAFRFFMKVWVSENKGVFTITNIFKNALWQEREVWDMFGIVFFQNKDLRRILTDYGFEGFPLRKDFPLTGYLEVRFDDEKASLVYEPVELTQEYRFFSFLTPWENLEI